ncbi:hypothetical protein F2P81_007816 [Scophthalmus maximus]|uniref:Uncharacterized protein n=1 Tax=Scophthalmus maximus TaxID=52904 RepID=A0A6A4T942_SCOMX|nr:hypothetical protein F2P81_007816 [Scophthalmus maximus]
MHCVRRTKQLSFSPMRGLMPAAEGEVLLRVQSLLFRVVKFGIDSSPPQVTPPPDDKQTVQLLNLFISIKTHTGSQSDGFVIMYSGRFTPTNPLHMVRGRPPPSVCFGEERFADDSFCCDTSYDDAVCLD